MYPPFSFLFYLAKNASFSDLGWYISKISTHLSESDDCLNHSGHCRGSGPAETEKLINRS